MRAVYVRIRRGVDRLRLRRLRRRQVANLRLSGGSESIVPAHVPRPPANPTTSPGSSAAAWRVNLPPSCAYLCLCRFCRRKASKVLRAPTHDQLHTHHPRHRLRQDACACNAGRLTLVSGLMRHGGERTGAPLTLDTRRDPLTLLLPHPRCGCTRHVRAPAAQSLLCYQHIGTCRTSCQSCRAYTAAALLCCMSPRLVMDACCTLLSCGTSNSARPPLS